MKHAKTSKADLCFLIPPGATKAEDIDITLVYCNQRIKCEDAVDHLRFWAKQLELPESCIAFYHARVGEKQKRKLEELLRRGEICILVCTDAVGMVCPEK
jgi:superfamily II DNA helicase RecQ